MLKWGFEDKAVLLLGSVGPYDPEILQWILSDKERNDIRLKLESECQQSIKDGDEESFRKSLKVLRDQWRTWAEEFNTLFPPRKTEKIRGYEIVYKR